jgi:hypothetical protein
MRSLKFVLAAAVVSFSTMTFADDLPIAAPPVYAPPADFGGWYLRGALWPPQAYAPQPLTKG